MKTELKPYYEGAPFASFHFYFGDKLPEGFMYISKEGGKIDGKLWRKATKRIKENLKLLNEQNKKEL